MMTPDQIAGEILYPKARPFIDRKYLDHLRESECELSGFENSEFASVAVDPAHVGGLSGGAGKGRKCHDFEALPLRHDLHMEMDAGFRRFWLRELENNPALQRDMVRAFAILRFLKWKLGAKTDLELVETVIRKDAA